MEQTSLKLPKNIPPVLQDKRVVIWGQFGPGQMVKEFDEVVFSAELNQVHGPVQTQFGYHLLGITERGD